MRTALIIPTFNAGKLWKTVLDGLETQTLQPDQKIVIDSSSDDQTAQLAKQYGFEVCKIARHTSNAGLARWPAARRHVETGITAVYDRHGYDAEKRAALDFWGDRLEAIIQDGKTGRVLRFEARR